MESAEMDTNLMLFETAPIVGPAVDLSEAARLSPEKALAGTGKLPPKIVAMPGLSVWRYRYFINNLLKQITAPMYLMIGRWARSTLCTAIFGNDVDAVAIDNWSLFGDPSDKFLSHLLGLKRKAGASFVERDFRKVDFWRTAN
jgi:hypothetical protein